MHNGIINRAALRTLILRKCKELRTGWPCVCVSEEVLEAYENALFRRVVEDVKSHPTRGKTFVDGGYRDLPNSDTQKDAAVIRNLRAKIRRQNK